MKNILISLGSLSVLSGSVAVTAACGDKSVKESPEVKTIEYSKDTDVREIQEMATKFKNFDHSSFTTQDTIRTLKGSTEMKNRAGITDAEIELAMREDLGDVLTKSEEILAEKFLTTPTSDKVSVNDSTKDVLLTVHGGPSWNMFDHKNEWTSWIDDDSEEYDYMLNKYNTSTPTPYYSVWNWKSTLGVSVFVEPHMKMINDQADKIYEPEEIYSVVDFSVHMLRLEAKYWKSKGKNVHIIGHSYGGLLTFDYIKKYGSTNKFYAKSITVAAGRLSMSKKALDEKFTFNLTELAYDGDSLISDEENDNPKFRNIKGTKGTIEETIKFAKENGGYSDALKIKIKGGENGFMLQTMASLIYGWDSDNNWNIKDNQFGKPGNKENKMVINAFYADMDRRILPLTHKEINKLYRMGVSVYGFHADHELSFLKGITYFDTPALVLRPSLFPSMQAPTTNTESWKTDDRFNIINWKEDEDILSKAYDGQDHIIDFDFLIKN